MRLKKLILRYFIEFIVIVMGISISFYLEKTNLNAYNEKLKNISLAKIYKNLTQDLIDLEFNASVHRDAAYSGQQIVDRGRYLFENDRDSLGYHLTLVTSGNTFFLDNKEEYTAMKNSGLIELIENQDLIAALQSRYAETKVFKIFDDLFQKVYFDLKRFTFRNVSAEKKPFTKFYGPIQYGAFVGKKPIGLETMNYIIEKTEFHRFHVQIMESRMEEDKEILKLILKELKNDSIQTKKNSWSGIAITED